MLTSTKDDLVTSSNPAPGGVIIGSGLAQLHQSCRRRSQGLYLLVSAIFELSMKLATTAKLAVNTRQLPVALVGWAGLTSVVMRAPSGIGITNLSLNSIDVLTGLETIKICTAYKTPDGQVIKYHPASLKLLQILHTCL